MSGTGIARPTIGAVDRVRVGALAAVVLVAACSSRAKPSMPAPTVLPAPTATFVAPSLDIEQPGLTPSTGQSDTGWGPIWNELPPGFPKPQGAEPAEVDSGPVSAAWTVASSGAANPVADSVTIAKRYADAFSAAGYGGGRDGPLEDGAYTAWASNGYGCDILVTAKSQGEETLVTVLYGAGCPFSWPES
jgi:hypothetical protein